MKKISDTGFDAEIKQQLLEKNYHEEKTSDRLAQDTKHNVRWSKFFKL